MPSSELAYKTLYAALEARVGARSRATNDIFVETNGPTAATSYMFIVRAAAPRAVGVFAHVDKRCATAPRVDPIDGDTADTFLAALPSLALASPPETRASTQPGGGVSYELRLRNSHVDVTMHFANPHRDDLVALAEAARALIAEQNTR